MIGRIFTVGGLTLLSRLTGFARDIVLAAVLGAGPIADAFFVALRLPNHFRAIFAEGAFNAAFVPAYARIRQQGGADPAKLFADRVFTLLFASEVVLLAIALMFTPTVISGLAPGFSDDPGRFVLAVELTRITFPYLLLVSLVTLYSGRSQFAREIIDEIRRHLAGRHFSTVIRYSVKLAEAASHGLPILGYCHRCTGFQDYEALTAEVLQMEAASAPNETLSTITGEQGDSPHPSAPVMSPEGVFFALEAPDATRVQLVGDFNGWVPDGNEMTLVGMVWTRVLKLPPGRYRYRYVIDGTWCSDPLNEEVELSPYGGYNSVIVVAGNSPGETADAA